MSLTKLVFPLFCWGELANVLSFLTIKDLWLLGSCNKSAFITFLREKSLRHTPKNLLTLTRFLSKGSGHGKVLLASYPRSGNSFLRKLLEIRTSIVTGSDSRPNRTLSASLLRCGYKGEGVTDDSVWIVKSHYPERLGYMKFNVSRVILLVRNPFDAIESYFHMGMTNTHDKALSKQAFESLSKTWQDCVANEGAVWSAFHSFWLSRAAQVPILLVRYEDILTNQQEVMEDISRFICEGAVPAGHKRFFEECNSTASNSSNDIAQNRTKSVQRSGISPDLRLLKLSPASPVGENQSPDTIQHCDGSSLSNGSSSSTGQQSQVELGAGPTGYTPKKKKIGKALDVLSTEHVFSIVRSTNQYLVDFGYDLTPNPDQNESKFALRLKNLTNEQGQIVFSKRVPTAAAVAGFASAPPSVTVSTQNALEFVSGAVRINESFSVRHIDDPFGRKFTDTRRALTADDTHPFETL